MPVAALHAGPSVPVSASAYEPLCHTVDPCACFWCRVEFGTWSVALAKVALSLPVPPEIEVVKADCGLVAGMPLLFFSQLRAGLVGLGNPFSATVVGGVT